MEQLIISLISGAVGGNAAGAGLKNLNLGPLLNSVVGAIGGVGGGGILSAMGGAEGIIGQLAGGGIGGAVLTAVVGLIRQRMAK